MSEFYALTKGPDYGDQGMQLNDVDPADAVGFFDGTGASAANGLYRAALKVGAVGTMAAVAPALPFISDEKEDAYFDGVVDPIFRKMGGLDDNAHAYGTGARIIGGLVDVGGSVLAGGPTAYISGETVSRTALEIRDHDKTLGQAAALGAVSGLAATADVAIPSGFMGSLVRRVAMGSAANVATGTALRGVEAGVLSAQGDERTIKVLDAEAMAVDGILGGFFGALPHAKPSHEHVDAAMTVADKTLSDTFSLGDAQANHDQMQTMRMRAQEGKPIIEPGDVTDVPPEAVSRMETAHEAFRDAIREDMPDLAPKLEAPTVVPPARVIAPVDVPAPAPAIGDKAAAKPPENWLPRDGTDIGPSRAQIRATAAELDAKGFTLADDKGVKRTATEILDQAEQDFANAGEFDAVFEAAAECVLRARG